MSDLTSPEGLEITPSDEKIDKSKKKKIRQHGGKKRFFLFNFYIVYCLSVYRLSRGYFSNTVLINPDIYLCLRVLVLVRVCSGNDTARVMSAFQVK